MPSVHLSSGATASHPSDSHQPPPQPQSQPPPSTSLPPLPTPIPRDARLIALILASMGIPDAEPKVLHQLLEFSQRYLHEVMSDALVYADHAASSSARGAAAAAGLSMDDVQLAIQSRLNHSFTQPPSKDMLLSLAESINSVPLPPISERYGLRLPPAEQTLTNVNFNIVPHPPPDEDEEEEEGDEDGRATPKGGERGAKEGTVGEEDADDEDGDDGTAITTIGNVQANVEIEVQRGTKRSLDEDEDYD